jgi:GH18 family chitinase
MKWYNISDRDRFGGHDVVRTKKRKKKSARQLAEEFADAQFSAYIHARDKFCVTCYENVHAKGTRRIHTFENVKIPANLAAALQAERERLLGGAGANKSSTISASAAKRGKAKKQHWEEFYDSSAKAKYCFNKVTGEASWISPF